MSSAKLGSASEDVSRRDANYHPTVWGDFFLTHSSNFLENNDSILEKHEELKQEVRNLLVVETIDLPSKIQLTDEIIRLGVGYHFEMEIKAQLEKLHDHQLHLNFDLLTTSVWFRLLRGHGFSISSDVFKRFKNTKGEFETEDARTLWCLYEATHLRVDGEDILEEAIQFSRKKLEALLPELSFPLNECVRDALHIPYHLNVQRWDIEAVKDIPKYMQVIYTGMLGIFEDFKDNLINARGKDYCIDYAIEVFKEIVRSYQREAEYFHTGYVPSYDEYMENSIISGGYKMFIILMLIGRGEFELKETLDWASTIPEMVKASSLIARYIDDLQTYKAEEERGETVSAVRCYMREYGVSEEEACKKMREMIEIEWKRLNKTTLEADEISSSVVIPSLNFTRVLEVMYDKGDGYSDSQGVTKDRIAALLRHAIEI
nr:terpene synthase 3 [Aquilaria agallochum]